MPVHAHHVDCANLWAGPKRRTLAGGRRHHREGEEFALCNNNKGQLGLRGHHHHFGRRGWAGRASKIEGSQYIGSPPSLATLRPLSVGATKRASTHPPHAPHPQGACEKGCGVTVICGDLGRSAPSCLAQRSSRAASHCVFQLSDYSADLRPGPSVPASAAGLPKPPFVDACERGRAAVETRSMVVELELAWSL